MTGPVIGFTKDTARRIKRKVTERTPARRPYVEEIPYIRELDAAITTSAIPAATQIGPGQIAPGSGTGVSLEFDYGTGQARVYTGDDALKNYYSVEIPQDTVCAIMRTRIGNWMIISTDCP